MAVHGKGARQKGFSYEREIAKDFQEIGWEGAGRQLEYQANECFGIDLKNTSPFAVQCKRHKGYVPITTINEIKPPKGMYSILITKGDNLPAMAVMPWSELKELIGMLRKEEIL